MTIFFQPFHFPNFINNLVKNMPVTAAHIVAIHTGKIIAVGLLEPSEFLIAITVVGIICIDAVFKTIKVAIELDNTFLSLFSFCKLFMAFSPNGVAAFPKPNIFAIIFIDISLCTSEFGATSGNRNFIIGFKKPVSLFIIVVLLAICIIPFHKHIVPNKLIHNFTASSVLVNIDEFSSDNFPEKIANINDIIINIGQTIFNKFITYLILFCVSLFITYKP